jgi:hypothetical protein
MSREDNAISENICDVSIGKFTTLTIFRKCPVTTLIKT